MPQCRLNQFIACSVLALYLLALVAAPALHWHLFDHHIAIAEQSPENEDACPLCEFLRSAIPLSTEYEPPSLQADAVAETVHSPATPLVAYATILPPARAPPSV
ncbi:MAG: hypothetical protein FWG73_01170 [Planctomycetaceae bacterium]|nr:hypothetical protein [Planctomycetaceae bacterium]